MKILAIDPGSTMSAFVVIDTETFIPLEFDKINNSELIDNIKYGYFSDCEKSVIEMIAGQGATVGKTVFDTCVWIGRFYQGFCNEKIIPEYIFRREEKLNLCGTMKANDKMIREALIKRFAKHDFKNGKGTKDKRDFFYGFANDVWQAYATGITYIDKNAI